MQSWRAAVVLHLDHVVLRHAGNQRRGAFFHHAADRRGKRVGQHIGRPPHQCATAIRFAAAGGAVTIADRNAAGLDETAAMMAALPQIQPYDASDFDSCRHLVDVAATDGLDVLCNISGILKWGPSADFGIDDFETIMRVNATSVFLLCQTALPHLVRSKGNIVNTVSSLALQGHLIQAAYSSSKAAIIQMTRAIAASHGKAGIRCNAVAPGMTMTSALKEAFPPPLRQVVEGETLRDQLGEPEDIAEALAFLASSAARNITGHVLECDGGGTSHVPGLAGFRSFFEG